MEKGFAYVDVYGIIHIVAAKETAKQCGRGEVVEVDGEKIPFSNGFPEYDGRHVRADITENEILYGKGQIPLEKLPTALQELFVGFGYGK